MCAFCLPTFVAPCRRSGAPGGVKVAMQQVLDAAVQRYRTTGTWKQWVWQQHTFSSAGAFRAFLIDHVCSDTSRPFLTTDRLLPIGGADGTAAVPPATWKALSARLATVGNEVADVVSVHDAVLDNSARVRPSDGAAPQRGRGGACARRRATPEERVMCKEAQLGVCVQIATALADEHELLYRAVAEPVREYIKLSAPPPVDDATGSEVCRY